ncbi:MAG: IS21-like element helper ATPase IstB [Bacillota bacterium]
MTTALLLDAHLKRLKLPSIRRQYATVARDAIDHNRTYEEFLLALLEQEVQQRDTNMMRERMRRAGFPEVKTLDSFDFTAIPSLNKPKVLALGQCEFIRRKENVLLIGNPGTGKTHIATALGVQACRAGHRVRFWRTSTLVNELIAAQQEYRLGRFEKAFQRADVIIVDELGFIPLERHAAELLFQLLASRHELGSLVVTSNLDFKDWTRVFGDETLTAALLDRLTHNAEILVFAGESYRFRQSMRRREAEG